MLLRLWLQLSRIWLAVSCIVCSSSAQLNYTSSDTLKSLLARTHEDSFIVVTYCLPWYDRCKALLPELEAAKEALSPWSVSVILLDCEGEEAAFCLSQGVDSYPTIRIWHGDQQSRYRGRFRTSSIITEVLKGALPLVSMADERTFKTLKSLENPLLLFFNPEHDEHPQNSRLDVIQEVARSLLGNFFVITISDPALINNIDINIDSSSIVMFNRLDETRPVYQGRFSSNAIIQFANKVSTPLVARLDLPSYANYIKSGIPLCFIFAETREERKSLAEKLKHIALDLKGQANFATVDAKKLAFLAEPLGLDPNRFPAFAVQAEDEIYVFDQEAELEAIAVEKFIHQILGRPEKEL